MSVFDEFEYDGIKFTPNITKNDLIGLLLLGMVAGSIIGFAVGQELQLMHDDKIIDDNANPLHVLHTSYGYYSIQKLNESCVTAVCVADELNRSIP